MHRSWQRHVVAPMLASVATVCAAACGGTPTNCEQRVSVRDAAVDLLVEETALVTFFVSVEDAPRVTAMSNDPSTVSASIASSSDLQITCLRQGETDVFVVIEECAATVAVTCSADWTMTWDSLSEQVTEGESRTVGLNIGGEDGQDGLVAVRVNPDGPVELLSASVGTSIMMPMFTPSELSYEYTQPENPHLIQFRCTEPGTVPLIAEGLFERDNGGFRIPVNPRDDLQVECLPDSGSGGTGGSGGAGGTGGTQTFLPYLYVMIVDKEDPSTSDQTMTSGVDIFGVQIDVGGVLQSSSTLELCTFGPGDNSAANDCNQAIGVPSSTCSPDTGDFVALGGTGQTTTGRLIVSFSGAEITEGSQIIVHECGSAQNPEALDEFYDSFVGVEPVANSPHWVQCHLSGTSIESCTVPALPPVPAP